jgi:predicted nucleic acid-binding protein
MAKIFIDTNIFIDILTDRSKINLEAFDNHELCLSILSIHIATYLLKIEIPDKIFNNVVDSCNTIGMSAEIYTLASQGPTKDLEDNMQLHSCVQNDCEYFLTNDKELLKMIYFGKTKIIKDLSF